MFRRLSLCAFAAGLFLLAAPARSSAQALAAADVDGDCVVTKNDAALVQASLGSKRGQPGFVPATDVNGDGVVNNTDVTFVSRNVGKQVCQTPPPPPPPPAPTIVASVAPPANAAGWHRTNVTVSFACTDAVSCPTPVLVTTEGAGQVVARTVINSAGVGASAQVTLNIDKTAPVVTMTVPKSAAPGQAVTVSLAVSDLSGVQLAELFDNGDAAGTDSAAPFAFPFTIPAGARNGSARALFARVKDRADNYAAVEERVLVAVPDTTPPAVSIRMPPSAAPGALVPIVVQASDNDAVARLSLFRGETELKTVSVEPYLFQINQTVPGEEGATLTFTARAEDASGNIATTAANVVVASVAPEVSQTLELHVDPPVSPTFQTTTVIAGSLGPGVPRPPLTGTFIASLAPPSARQGQTVDVTITGERTAFSSTDTDVTFGPGITVASVVVNSPTEAVARIVLAPDAGVGPRVVVARSGNSEAALLNAFQVEVGATQLTGRILGVGGAGIAGAQVCVPGTSLCVTTDSGGRFLILDAPLDATRVVVTASGYIKSSVPMELSADSAGEIGDVQVIEEDVPPPPPLPNSPPVTPAMARAMGQGATEFLRGPQNLPAVVQMIRNAIIAAGGPEIGVFDENGTQLNPLVTGAGYVSYRHFAVEAMAWREIAGNMTTLGETLSTLILSYAYSSPSQVPSLGRMLQALQAETNRAWANPASPGAALMFLLFNQGRAASAEPPTISLSTPLNELQAQMLISSFLTFAHREFVETPAPTGGTGEARVTPFDGFGFGPVAPRAVWRGDLAQVDGRALTGIPSSRQLWRYPAYGGGAEDPPAREASQPWINVYSELVGPQFRTQLYGTMGKLCGAVTAPAVDALGLTPNPEKDKWGARDLMVQAVPKCPEVVKLAQSVMYTQFAATLDREKTFFSFFKKEGITVDIQSRASRALQGSRPNSYEIFPDGSSRQLQTGLSAESKKLLTSLQDAKIENAALTEYRKRAFGALQTKDYKDSTLYQDWQQAKNEARKLNLTKNLISVGRGLSEGFFGMAEGVAFGSIMDLEVDLLLQSLRPRPPFILDAFQMEDEDTGEKQRGVAVVFQRSDNDDPNSAEDGVWTYELYRQTGADVYYIGFVKATTVKRVLTLFDTNPPDGTHLYRVMARRRIGGPIEYAPTDFDTVYAPVLGALVPGLSGTSTVEGTFTPFAGTDNKGTVKFSSGISFGALKTALDPLAKTLKGLAYQSSDPSDPAAVHVTLRTAPPPVGKIAVDPYDRRAYLGIPFFDRIFQTSPTFQSYTSSGFARTDPSGTFAGLGIDRFGHLYTDNLASDAQFGGRIFRYKYPNGERELVGSVNYYSQLLMFANPVAVADARIGPSPDGEALYIADSFNQRITRLTLPENFAPGVTSGRNVSQPYAQSSIFNFDGSTSMAFTSTGTLYLNQGDNIVRVPPQGLAGGASYTPSFIFRPGTTFFQSTSGLDADVYGNLYISDDGTGRITMLPWMKVSSLFTADNISATERKLLTVARGLSSPAGVKVRAFNKGLAFFDAERSYATLAFGFSAIVRDTGGNPIPNATVLIPGRSNAGVTDGDGVVVIPDIMVGNSSPTVNYIIRYDGKADAGTLYLTPGVHNILELTFDPKTEVGPIVPLTLVRSPLPDSPGTPIAPAGRTIVVSAEATVPGVRAAAAQPAGEPVAATCPTASLLQPATQMVADSDDVMVRGLVSPSSIGTVNVEVNGEPRAAAVDANGEFSLGVTLTSGKTHVSITVDGAAMAAAGCEVGAATAQDFAGIALPVDVLSPAHNDVEATLDSLGYRQSIRGQIRDKQTHAPLIGLPVSIPGTAEKATTDRFGVFQIDTTLTDYQPAIDYANQTVEETIEMLDLLASTLRAEEEAAALDQIEVVLNAINRITYDQSPVAAANARKLLAVIDAAGPIVQRIAQAIESDSAVAAADVDAIQTLSNSLEPWRNMHAIEITSTETPDLSVLITVNQ